MNGLQNRTCFNNEDGGSVTLPTGLCNRTNNVLVEQMNRLEEYNIKRYNVLKNKEQ